MHVCNFISLDDMLYVIIMQPNLELNPNQNNMHVSPSSSVITNRIVNAQAKAYTPSFITSRSTLINVQAM